MRKKTETIAFRADDDLLRLIDRQRDIYGLSRGNWVKAIVISWLHNQGKGIDEVAQELKSLSGQIETVRLDVAKAVYIQLTVSNSVSDEEAREIIRSQFSKSEG